MTKEDWIEVLRVVFSKDWSYWVSFCFTIVNAVLLMITLLFTAKAAKSSKEAVTNSIEMYKNDSKERELQVMPIFELHNVVFANKTKFLLTNINKQYPISISSFGINAENLKTNKINDSDIEFEVEKTVEENEKLLITLQYTALNHSKYKTTLKVRRDSHSIFIDQINTINIVD